MNKSLNELTPADLIELLQTVDKKTWIKVGIGTVIAVVFGVFVAWPAWFTRYEVKDELKTIQTKINTYETLKIQKPHFMRRKEDTKKFIGEAKDRLFQKGEASLLLGQISKLAIDSDITIVASRPKQFEGKFPNPFDDLYEASQYDFTIEGGYHNIGQFVSHIESFPKLLRVQMSNIKSKENEEDDDGNIIVLETHFADLSLTAVSFKKAKAAA